MKFTGVILYKCLNKPLPVMAKMPLPIVLPDKNKPGIRHKSRKNDKYMNENGYLIN